MNNPTYIVHGLGYFSRGTDLQFVISRWMDLVGHHAKNRNGVYPDINLWKVDRCEPFEVSFSMEDGVDAPKYARVTRTWLPDLDVFAEEMDEIRQQEIKLQQRKMDFAKKIAENCL